MSDKPLDPTLQLVHDSMMQGLGQLADYFGFNRIMGELYAALLLNPDAMSLDDLKSAVHKSKASISMNTRTLEFMGAVKEVWVREDNPSNRKFYEAEHDFWKILQKILGGRELKDLELAIGILRESISMIEQAKPGMDDDMLALAEFYVTRLSRLIEFFRFAKLIITTVLERSGEIDLSEVTRITIE